MLLVSTALALCLNMLSGTDAACVAIDLALCLKKKRKRIVSGPRSCTKEDRNRHTHTHTHTPTRRPYERLAFERTKLL
jgi:hypothetical protein